MCLADFALTHVYEKVNINYELDHEKICIKPVADIHEEEDVKTVITVKLKNVLRRLRKRTRAIVIRFRTIFKLKNLEEY